MTTEYLKFIKVSKDGHDYYYNCPDFFNSSSDCFNHMRADLNRVLLETIPSGYTTINCNSVTTTIAPTTLPQTTSVTTANTTLGTSTTTSSTTLRPCDIGFDATLFVNDINFPYDYTLQQGYIQITLRQSTYSRKYQFQILSGTNIIKDWTNPVAQNIVAFKLNCANYTIRVRDYDDINCISEITNVSIPCLTISTTSSTTSLQPCVNGLKLNSITFLSGTQYTVAFTSTNVTSISWRLYNNQNIGVAIGNSGALTTQQSFVADFGNLSDGIYTLMITPDNCSSTQSDGIKLFTKNGEVTTTTQFIPTPCALYYNFDDKIYYKDIQTNVDKLLYSGSIVSADISLYNGNLYLYESNSYNIQKISLATLSASTIHTVGDFDTSAINASTHDSNGNFYLANGNIIKFSPIGDDYQLVGNIVELFGYYITAGDISYIANMDAFAMTTQDNKVILVKADGSNLILKEVYLGSGVRSFAMFIYNNELYCTQYGQEKNYVLKVDFNLGTVSRDTTKKLIDFANGGTQNANCMTLNYNDQFKIANMEYNCIDNFIFNLKLDILNGSGSYEYSIDGLGYTPITSNKFDANFNITTVFIYIRDIDTRKVYKFRRNRDVTCVGYVSTTTSSTTTTPCVSITGLVINGATNVNSNDSVNYTAGTYNGSTITSYLWQVDGGTVQGNDDTDSVNILWDGGVTLGRVTLTVGNCNGTKTYFRKINIA